VSGHHTPEDLVDFGYRIEVGNPGHLSDSEPDRYWWTWIDPIAGGDVAPSEGDWTTAEEAVADARRDMKENE
jgi:hypothetical protein